jgi:glutathione synthase/RimK-type ligase-like ATP-grasp enzyme
LTIAFITYAGRPEITSDDELAAAALRHRGHKVEAVPWDGVVAAEKKFDLLVLRSPWNYHLAPDAFLAWLDDVARKTPVVNAPAMVRWNTHKRYLLELAAALPVIPTALVARGEHVDVRDLFGRFGERIVIKPAISASAFLTASFTADGLAEAQTFLDQLTAERDALVQPFLDTIATHGEVSVMYFGGRFSHAVIKRPKAGEFRVQHELGGSIEPYMPDAALLALCDAALQNVPGRAPSVYARIDVVADTRSGWQLQELELIEPSLYLEYAPGAAERFAEAIAEQMQKQ